MANHESGNHINVENLDPLIRKVELIGEAYNPVKEPLKLPNLFKLYDNGKFQIKEVDDYYASWKLTVDDRQFRFKKVKTTVTRIIGNLYGMDVPPAFIEDAKQFQAKINSTRLTKPKSTDIEKDLSPDKSQHSVSQQSFTSVLYNFKSLFALIEKEPGYKTNIQDLSLPALKNFCQELEESNQQMSKASTGLVNARIQRNLFLYTPETGSVDIALAVKNFVKGIFGASHPTYLDIKKISFRNIKG